MTGRRHRPLRGHRAAQEARAAFARDEAEDALAIVASLSAREALGHWRAALNTPEFVYFIQGENHGPVKIGTARDPVARLGELQCGNPDDLILRELVLGGRDVEKAIHDRWLQAHVRGEWFGHGYEAAILAFAGVASAFQIAEHRKVGAVDFALFNRAATMAWDLS